MRKSRFTEAGLLSSNEQFRHHPEDVYQRVGLSVSNGNWDVRG